MARHKGLTVIELLVVVAIIGVLIGLVSAGVQSARAAAARAGCGNNLRQVSLGLQHYHAAHGRFPPGIDRGRSYPFMTWCTRLLPYVEQQPAWAEAVEDYRTQPSFFGPPPHRNLARPMNLYVCPAGQRVVGTTVDGQTAAFTYYLGVSGDVDIRHTGVFYRDSVTRIADITDGTSNTLFVGERPPSADSYFGWWYAGIGQATGDGSADSVMAATEYNRTYREPTCPKGPYSFSPGTAPDSCSMFHYWSLHGGGAHFGFADGSVRFLGYAAAPVMPALATRSGGESVDVP